MPEPIVVFLLSGVIIMLFGLVLFCLWKIHGLSVEKARASADFEKRMLDLEFRKKEELESATQRSLGQSRAILFGQVGEQFAPYLPGFPYQPKDARFLGQPVDYIVFKGLNDDECCERGELEIVLCEIKSGNSALSKRERAVKLAVEKGRVRFETLRLGENGFASKADR